MSLAEFAPSITSHTIGYFNLNGNSTDGSSQANNGTDSNMTYGLAYGRFGQGGLFNGSSSKILLTVGKMESSVWTVALWMNLGASFPQSNPIQNGSSYSSSGTWSGWQIYSLANGNLTCYNFYAGNNYKMLQTDAGDALSAGIWYHIVLTNDGTNLTWYKNGKQIKQGVSGGNTYWGQSSYRSSSIGVDNKANGGSPYFWYKGNIDSVIVEDNAWSAIKVAKYYAQAKGHWAVL
jgi:hypothetical protein